MNQLASMSAAAIAALLTPVFFGNANGEQQSSGTPKTVSKSGIPYLPDSDDAGPLDLVKAIRARRKGKLLNLDRMLLHSPNFAKGWNSMFAAIRNELSLQPKLREIAILAVGALNKAEYEWIHHEPEFLAAGGTREQLDALKNADAAQKNTKLFDEPERATLALTTEMTKNIRVSAATLKRVRAVLPDQQTVELIGTIAGYNLASRFLIATGVDLE
jgi:alkylhydroperoxidase family enzyme